MRRCCWNVVLVTVVAGCGGSVAARSADARAPTTSARAFPAQGASTSTTSTTRARETGATGPTGATGAPGPPGEPGATGLSGYEVVRDSVTITMDLDHGGSLEHSVSCPPDKTILGGGAYVTTVPPGDPNASELSDAFEYLQRSEPSSTTTWTALAAWDHYNTSSSQQLRLTVTATCAFVR